MAREDRYIKASNGTEWTIPNAKESWGHRTGGTGQRVINAIIENGGEPLTDDQLAKALSHKNTLELSEKEKEWYYDIIDANSDQLGYDSSVYSLDNGTKNIKWFKADEFDLKAEQEKYAKNKSSAESTYNSMVEEAYQDRLNLMTDPTGVGAQKFRDTMYGAIAEEQAIAEQSLGQAELDAYRMLGQQQLELENTIAEQRKKALVSGTTSAQLAAGQLQNIFAAQSGAAQVAQSLANQRTQLNQTYAEKRTGVETSLYDYINQQQTIAATAGAQNLAALSSYYSYANKNYNDMVSLANAKRQLGASAYNQLLEDMGYKEK